MPRETSEIIAKAKALGQKTYFTGLPCVNGHLSPRHVANRTCLECQRAHQGAFRQSHKPRRQVRTEKHREKDRDRYRADIENNRSKAREKARKKRLNPSFRIRSNISWYLSRFIRKKGVGTSRLLKERCGYSVQELCIHLEKQFVDGMNWENYGRQGWHIDHITPASSFDQTDVYQFAACWHLSNLRPMWGVDNKIKNAKIQFLI